MFDVEISFIYIFFPFSSFQIDVKVSDSIINLHIAKSEVEFFFYVNQSEKFSQIFFVLNLKIPIHKAKLNLLMENINLIFCEKLRNFKKITINITLHSGHQHQLFTTKFDAKCFNFINKLNLFTKRRTDALSCV